jgi:hypothetical protein
MAAWKYGVVTARLIAMQREQTLFFEQNVLRSNCIFLFIGNRLQGSHRLDNTQSLWDYSLELHCKNICKHRPILIYCSSLQHKVFVWRGTCKQYLKHPVPTAQETHRISIKKTPQVLILGNYSIIIYYCIVCVFSCLTVKRQPNAPPDALPALLRTPRLGEI